MMGPRAVNFHLFSRSSSIGVYVSGYACGGRGYEMLSPHSNRCSLASYEQSSLGRFPTIEGYRNSQVVVVAVVMSSTDRVPTIENAPRTRPAFRGCRGRVVGIAGPRCGMT